MGQQQLLILVFSIVLVGAAVVMGTHALKTGKTENNRTIVFREALSIVADLQAWKLKPHLLGGGANVDGFARIDFKSLGYPHLLLSNRVYKTENGCYLLQAVGKRHVAELIISAPSCADKDFVARVRLRGPRPDDVQWWSTPADGFQHLEPPARDG